MGELGPLFDIMKSRPELLVIALPLAMYYFERRERCKQQEANKDLTDKLLELTSETVQKATETNILLQILVGRSKR